MDTRQQSLETLKDIKNMMERSSRFISLSGLSGVAAGVCALVGAGFAYRITGPNYDAPGRDSNTNDYEGITNGGFVKSNTDQLLMIAILTLAASIILAFIFTWLRSRKNGTPLWGNVSRKLTLSMIIPMAIGGIYLLKLLEAGNFSLLAPGCLVFYGLALMNASRYTLDEIKWLGYAELVTGTLCLFFTGYGLYFWAFGFGILHIVYGLLMWYRYERSEAAH